MWIVCIPIVIILLFLVYNYLLLPKWKQRLEKENNRLKHDFALSIQGKEDAMKKKFINENSYVIPIAKEVNKEEIIGIISCQEKRELKDFLRQQATEITGRIAGHFTGTRFREVDNTEYYYLTLTTKNLHYLHYSLAGMCKQHLTFLLSDIKQPELGNVTSEDMLKHNAFTGEVKKLSFTYFNDLYRFFYYDHVWGHPLGKSTGNQKEEFAQIDQLFTEPFKEYINKW